MLLDEIATLGKDLELLLYKLRDAEGIDQEIRADLDCAIRYVARAQAKADPGRRVSRETED